MGKPTFTARKDLGAVVARMVTDELTRIAESVADDARRNAPPTKTWVSVRDGHVRDPHVKADGQEVPENARFKLNAYEWDVQHPGAHGGTIRRGDGTGWDGPQARTVPGVYSYLNEPRDQTSGTFVQIVNCRCRIQVDQDGIARMVRVVPAVARGSRAVAYVVAEGDGVVVAEKGDVYPGPVTDPIAHGSYFMRRAAMAARNRWAAGR